MDHGKESVHYVGDIPKMWREVIPGIDRFLAVAPSELRDIRDSNVIQGSKGVFVKKLDALLQAYLNAIGK